MITLATLKDATAQQVFDQVVNHLAKQGVQSEIEYVSVVTGNKNKACAYRGNNGLMCAAGCLISDDEYTPDFDAIGCDYGPGKDWDTVISDGLAPSYHRSLIIDLQEVHDSAVHNWATGLDAVAKEYGLQFNIDKFEI